MKRFIQHEELARDSRFTRQSNVVGTMLAQMPDDVDTIVETFEKLESVIEQGVRGTAAEPLFAVHGAGFALLVANEPLDPNARSANTRLKLRLHGIFVGELLALEAADTRADVAVSLEVRVVTGEGLLILEHLHAVDVDRHPHPLSAVDRRRPPELRLGEPGILRGGRRHTVGPLLGVDTASGQRERRNAHPSTGDPHSTAP